MRAERLFPEHLKDEYDVKRIATGANRWTPPPVTLPVLGWSAREQRHEHLRVGAAQAGDRVRCQNWAGGCLGSAGE